MVKPRAGRSDGPKPLTLEQVRALAIAALAHALRGRNPDLSPEWAADALARKRRNVVPTQDLRAAVRALESLGSEGRNAKAPPSNSRQGFGFSELRGPAFRATANHVSRAGAVVARPSFRSSLGTPEDG